MKKTIITLILVGIAIAGKIQFAKEQERQRQFQQMLYEAAQKRQQDNR